MFDELDREFSFGSALIQLIVVYVTPFVALASLEGLLSMGEDTVLSDILGYVFIAAAGIALALLISTILPGSVFEGSTIWILPAGAEFGCAVWDTAWGRTQEIPAYFFGRGEAGWVMALLTMPTWGCCCYSAAMYWRLRGSRKRDGVSVRGGP